MLRHFKQHCSNQAILSITYAFHTALTFSAMQKRVQTSNEKVFSKNRVIRTATKRTETSPCPRTQCTYVPNPLCAVTQQCELGK